MLFIATYYGNPDGFLHELDATGLDVLSYWQGLGANERPPRWDLFDPLDVASALSRIILVEADGANQLSYKVVGSQETKDRGEEVSGKKVGEAYFGASKERVKLQYQLVMEANDACCAVYKFRPPEQGPVEDVSLYLPFTNERGETRFVLVYSFCRTTKS